MLFMLWYLICTQYCTMRKFGHQNRFRDGENGIGTSLNYILNIPIRAVM